MVLMASGYASLAFVTTVPLLCVALFAASLGAAIVRPTLTTALSLSIPNNQQGRALGLNQSILAIANIIGPMLAGLLLERQWFDCWAFVIGGLLLVAAILLLVLLKLHLWPISPNVQGNTSNVSPTTSRPGN
jgi:MFS family permease